MTDGNWFGGFCWKNSMLCSLGGNLLFVTLDSWPSTITSCCVVRRVWVENSPSLDTIVSSLSLFDTFPQLDWHMIYCLGRPSGSTRPRHWFVLKLTVTVSTALYGTPRLTHGLFVVPALVPWNLFRKKGYLQARVAGRKKVLSQVAWHCSKWKDQQPLKLESENSLLFGLNKFMLDFRLEGLIFSDLMFRNFWHNDPSEAFVLLVLHYYFDCLPYS